MFMKSGLVRARRFTYQTKLLLGLFLGVITGTVLTNLLAPEIMNQTGYFGGLFFSGIEQQSELGVGLMHAVCKQRFGEVIFGWILGLTTFATLAYCLLTFYGGYTVGVVLSITTCQKGLLGLPYYLCTLFPHYLLYLPVWFFLLWRSGVKREKPRFLLLLLLLCITFLGVLSETYLNPVFLNEVL